MALLPQELDFSEWTISRPIADGRHGRSVLINGTDGYAPKLQLADPTDDFFTIKEVQEQHVLLEPGSSEQVELLEKLDAFAIEQALTHCADWFGKQLTADTIQSLYRPLTAEALRLRISRSCNFYVLERDRYRTVTITQLQEGQRVLPCVQINGMYFKTREMGLSLGCSDLLVRLPPQPWPFRLAATVQPASGCLLPEHDEL